MNINDILRMCPIVVCVRLGIASDPQHDEVLRPTSTLLRAVSDIVVAETEPSGASVDNFLHF